MNKEIFFYIASFLADVGIGILIIAVPLVAIKTGASPFALGLIGFFFSLFYFSLSYVFGRVADKKGSFTLTITGCVIVLFASPIFLFSVPIVYIFVLMGLIGAGMAMFWSPIEAWIAKVSDNLPKSLGYFNISWCAGISVGSLMGGILFGINCRLPFIFTASFSLITMFSLYYCPRVSSAPVLQNIVEEKESKIKNSFVLIAWIGNFIAWFGIGTIRYLFPKLAVSLGITPFILGVLMFLISGIQAFISYVLGRTSKWHDRFNFLIFAQILMGIGFLIPYFSSSVLMFFCAFTLIGVGIGVVYFSSIYYSLAAGHSRGERGGVHEALVGLGGLVGPLMGGIVAQNFNIRAPFVLCTVMILSGIIIEKIIMKQNRKNRDIDHFIMDEQKTANNRE